VQAIVPDAPDSTSCAALALVHDSSDTTSSGTACAVHGSMQPTYGFPHGLGLDSVYTASGVSQVPAHDAAVSIYDFSHGLAHGAFDNTPGCTPATVPAFQVLPDLVVCGGGLWNFGFFTLSAASGSDNHRLVHTFCHSATIFRMPF
jgi:hypothetical protein